MGAGGAFPSAVETQRHLFVGERFTPRSPLESDLGAELNEEDGAKINGLGVGG